jgi:hypothetical protein
VTDVSEPVHERAADVLWRAGPDRVLTHRVGADADEAAGELIGTVALVWLALDEPATATQLADRLADAGLDGLAGRGGDPERGSLAADLELLVEAGLVHRRADP